MRLQINAKDTGFSSIQDVVIANLYDNRFIIPLNFEMLDRMMPYYQSGLRNRLCYRIMSNDYNQVIILPSPPAKPDTTYKISDISLEYEIVTQLDLAKCFASEYESMALSYSYDGIIRDRQILVNKLDKMWNWLFNMPCKSLKGISILFKVEQPYA